MVADVPESSTLVRPRSQLRVCPRKYPRSVKLIQDLEPKQVVSVASDKVVKSFKVKQQKAQPVVKVAPLAECGDRVYAMEKVSFLDGNPVWESIESALLPGEKIAAIFGSVQINRNYGGVLVISTDGIRFFDRKAYKRPSAPLYAFAYSDMEDLRQGINIILKTSDRSKYAINAGSNDDAVYDLMMQLGSAGPQKAGRLFVPLSITGLPLDQEDLIRVLVEEAGLVVSQTGREDLVLEYGELDAISAGGAGLQVDTRGGGMIGGGFGVAGFVVGAASAALYNRLTTRTDVVVETLLRIEGDGIEMVLLTPEVLPEDLDLEIAPARTRIKSAARSANAPAASVGQQLKELADLRDSGVLTEAEFSAAKAKLIG